ncbi:helicase-related protein [Sulfitobacter sabulilitoris]|uniref:Disulfide oxidoreductase n=1 Tax=Sulfitobacter sabulilitoris TaxID=2562655 RepID=A0A5S3PR84_9RHOB|nr:helicase-related protein [Sulfitobacter sabulilitoris]TMM55065.1 disulfide oxidoreductase [Sulfitobacter sabulilitoris]
MADASRVVAVLGPTNTGKTTYAIERMLAHRTGVIGLPLRLLAREVYDRIVAARGPSVVALVTGEERIVPPRTQYWVCTVEAMPEGMGCDFLAVDEIQLCADPERGHVFTDRLLRARGLHETLFLGADTMRGAIAELVPGVQFLRRERMSELTYIGAKKISRMRPRSAIVGFSVENVYAIAELIRRQKGGAAVVMGALSPRTRNAQVDMYQNGEVDYLVATDAIGMGLNLDVDHVAFSALSKFDGRRMRPLAPNELAQIAGRAGRGMKSGTFGVTGEAAPLDDGVARAIMDHQFTPQRKLNWRNHALQFGSVDRLISTLEAAPDHEMLVRAREADDLGALKALSQVAEVAARATDGPSVRLLWDVCRIPDFRGISHAEHASLLEVIFNDLHQRGQIPNDWLARQIKRIDRTDGDIDALSKRLAFIRTWTYVAQRKGWTDDESHWRGAARSVEDRLSDALHERLTQRFVDRRTSVLLRRLGQKEAMVADVSETGEVTVEGEYVGKLEGFRFSQDKNVSGGAAGAEAKTIKSAALQALQPQFHLRADRFYNAPDTEIDFTEQGGLIWGKSAVGKLVAGADPLKPQVEVFVDDVAGPEIAQKVQRRLQHFIDRKIAALFEPLMMLSRDEALTGLARGFAFRMVENFGILPRAQVADEVKALDQDARGALRKHGIRFGQFTIFMPLLLKPAPTRLRLVLWSLGKGLGEFPEAPPPGLVTIPTDAGAPEGADTMSGYRIAGQRAIRIDMLERLADMLRAEDSRGGFEAKADMLSITGMTLEQFADLMQGLGYKAEQGERTKVKPVDAVVPKAGDAALAPSADTTVPETNEAAAADTAPDDSPDTPVMDVAQEAPEGGIIETPEAPAPADVSEPVANIVDDGVAPVAEAPAEAHSVSDHIPDQVAEEVPVGTAPDAAVAGAEMETFFTFTWARPARGGQQGNRRGTGDRAPGKGKGGGPKGKKGAARGKDREPGGQKFSARPPKPEKKIDPDNPFAAALMGLKDNK